MNIEVAPTPPQFFPIIPEEFLVVADEDETSTPQPPPPPPKEWTKTIYTF